jgi:endonuclease G
MMKNTANRIVLVLLFGFFVLVGFQSTSSQEVHSIEIPAHGKHEIIICHTGYCLSYDEKFKLAKWVAYELTLAETQGEIGRKDKFKPDPLVIHNSASLEDYKNSGYDRGHLAPAADMKWSVEAMQESFYLSNMCPQDKSFNRGIWKKLEEQVREYAKLNKQIKIVTGPILQEGLPVIGNNKLPIPRFFYKAILDYSQPSIKAIAFVIKNEHSDLPLSHFAISIDSLEKLSGIDFFPLLPDLEENNLEKQNCYSCWETEKIH